MTTPSLHERAREERIELFFEEKAFWPNGNLNVDGVKNFIRAEISRAKTETLSLAQEAVPGENSKWEEYFKETWKGATLTAFALADLIEWIKEYREEIRKETLLALSKLR